MHPIRANADFFGRSQFRKPKAIIVTDCRNDHEACKRLANTERWIPKNWKKVPRRKEVNTINLMARLLYIKGAEPLP